MEKQYNVFIQWNENTSNYKRFDGGLEQTGTSFDMVEKANRAAADWLHRDMDNDYFYHPFIAKVGDGKGRGLQLGKDDKAMVIDFNSTEPASVDFGDGTIYVAEVQS